jgi:L-asparaginase/beta-aspartyl-peptidase (threonine type)
MIKYGIIAHGGAGSSEECLDGVRESVEAAFHELRKGGSALNAVIKAVQILEDDGRFNAGSGSLLRLDEKTIEMDAAIMDSKGTLGAVLAIKNVKNPVLVARAVSKTPHVALAGDGAESFARRLGFPPFYQVSPKSLENMSKIRGLIERGRLGSMNPRWKGVDVRKLALDTVGAVALDGKGTFAVATSTGGASPMITGRVGDTPFIGCGFYAGAKGAVAVTGLGEEIVKRMLARTVYDAIEQGTDVKTSCEKGVLLFPAKISVGVIAITQDGIGSASNRKMAHNALAREG